MSIAVVIDPVYACAAAAGSSLVVDKPNNAAAAVAARIDPAGWVAEFEVLFAAMAPTFARWGPRRRVKALLVPVESRSCWQVAEHAGEANPGGMQRLLASAVWDDA